MEADAPTTQQAVTRPGRNGGTLADFKPGHDPRRHMHGRTPSSLVKQLKKVANEEAADWWAPIVKARDEGDDVYRTADLSLKVLGMARQVERDESTATISIHIGGGVPGAALEDDA